MLVNTERVNGAPQGNGRSASGSTAWVSPSWSGAHGGVAATRAKIRYLDRRPVAGDPVPSTTAASVGARARPRSDDLRIVALHVDDRRATNRDGPLGPARGPAPMGSARSCCASETGTSGIGTVSVRPTRCTRVARAVGRFADGRMDVDSWPPPLVRAAATTRPAAFTRPGRAVPVRWLVLGARGRRGSGRQGRAAISLPYLLTLDERHALGARSARRPRRRPDRPAAGRACSRIVWTRGVRTDELREGRRSRSGAVAEPHRPRSSAGASVPPRWRSRAGSRRGAGWGTPGDVAAVVVVAGHCAPRCSRRARASPQGLTVRPRSAVKRLLPGLAVEELLDHRRELVGLGDQRDVPAPVDVQAGVGEQPRHDPGVHDRDDRVVVPGDDQRRLPDQLQERQAAPARARGQLVVVAAPRARGGCRRAAPGRPARGAVRIVPP